MPCSLRTDLLRRGERLEREAPQHFGFRSGGAEAGKQRGESLLAPVLSYRIALPTGVDPLSALKKLRQLAEEGSCILIGRCSDFVLETAGNIEFVSLFVYCDLAQKIRRVIEVDGVDTEEAVRRIQKINRQRRDYCRYYTGNNWGDIQLYDLPVNTTDITVPQAAELVKCYLKLRGYNV